MPNAVVTGGAGFIGSHVVDLLVDGAWDVTVVDDLSTGLAQNLNPNARFINGSVTNKDLMDSLLANSEYVFHTAALPRIQPSFDAPIQHEEVNVIGTIRCIEALKGNRRLKKFVLSASSSCYGTSSELPTTEQAEIACLSPYALQKYAAEQHAILLGTRFGIPVITLRYFNVYGPRSFNSQNPYNAYSSVPGIFHQQKKANIPFTITGDGEQKRDFVHVQDVAHANLLAALSECIGETYNVGSGRPITINNLASMFDHHASYIPEREGEARITWADISKIKAHLGWTPKTDIQTGLRFL
jgi:UDP-glucose 4-epimerase